MKIASKAGRAIHAVISAATVMAASTLFAVSTAAEAGDCPTDKIGVNVMQAGATMPEGVTDEVIASIDLAGQYGVEGRTMRMRRLVVQPNGVVPWHSHDERPANIYVVEGKITEYRSTCAVPIEHKAGDVTAESGDLSHWWKNNSNKPTVIISADIISEPKQEDEMM